jgi:hypothetical protein
MSSSESNNNDSDIDFDLSDLIQEENKKEKEKGKEMTEEEKQKEKEKMMSYVKYIKKNGEIAMYANYQRTSKTWGYKKLSISVWRRVRSLKAADAKSEKNLQLLEKIKKLLDEYEIDDA